MKIATGVPPGEELKINCVHLHAGQTGSEAEMSVRNGGQFSVTPLRCSPVMLVFWGWWSLGESNP